jgi:hypothetical protein
MSEIETNLPCACGGEILAQITVHSFGSDGSYWEPAEGAEWSLIDATCEACGATYDDAQISDAHEMRVQQRIAEHEIDICEDLYLPPFPAPATTEDAHD